MSRRTLAVLLRAIVLAPLAALWALFALSMLAAILFGWYAAGSLLLRLV